MYYTNNTGASNINSYHYESDRITVTFNGGATYLYTYTSAGAQEIEQMKTLADSGQGLNSFINRNVRLSYAEKIA
jgi:hypothetical protein